MREPVLASRDGKTDCCSASVLARSLPTAVGCSPAICFARPGPAGFGPERPHPGEETHTMEKIHLMHRNCIREHGFGFWYASTPNLTKTRGSDSAPPQIGTSRVLVSSSLCSAFPKKAPPPPPRSRAEGMLEEGASAAAGAPAQQGFQVRSFSLVSSASLLPFPCPFSW